MLSLQEFYLHQALLGPHAPCPMPGTHRTAHYSKSPLGRSSVVTKQEPASGVTVSLLPAALALFHSGCVPPVPKAARGEQSCPEMVAVREVPLSTSLMAPPWVYLSVPSHPLCDIVLLLLPLPTPPLLAHPFLLQKGLSSMDARTSLGCYAWDLALEEARIDRCLALYSPLAW